MKNKNINMLITAMILIIVFSVMLAVFLAMAHDEFDDNITVTVDGVTEKTLKVRDLRLSPTEKKEYVVGVFCSASGGYDISLTYVETLDGGMKPFVNVWVECEGVRVYEGTLVDLLDGGTVIRFAGELEAKDPLPITFCYEMPYEIGNEAQGTSADFDIKLKIEKN